MNVVVTGLDPVIHAEVQLVKIKLGALGRPILCMDGQINSGKDDQESLKNVTASMRLPSGSRTNAA